MPNNPENTRKPVRNSSIRMEDGSGYRVKTRKRNKHRSAIITIAMLVIALVLVLLPVSTNVIDFVAYNDVMSKQQAVIEDYDSSELESSLDKAYQFNESIAEDRRLSRNDYLSLLNLTDNGCMGVIEMPTLGVSLPIAHDGVMETPGSNGYLGLMHKGVTDGTDGSSLPVGGPSTHTVLVGAGSTATSRSASLMSEMSNGDLVYVYSGGRRVIYRVNNVTLVSDGKLSDTSVKQGRTLLTMAYSDETGNTAVVSAEQADSIQQQWFSYMPTWKNLGAIIVGCMTPLQMILFGSGCAGFVFLFVRLVYKFFDREPREIGRLKGDAGFSDLPESQ